MDYINDFSNQRELYGGAADWMCPDVPDIFEINEDMISEMIMNGILVQKENDVYEFCKCGAYFAIFAKVVTMEILKRQKFQQEMLSYAAKNRKELLKGLKSDQDIFDYAFLMLTEEDVSAYIIFVTIFLYAISPNQDCQDFLYNLCKRLFKNIFKICQNAESEHLSYPEFCTLAFDHKHKCDSFVPQDDVFIYHYFFERYYKTASCSIIYKIFEKCCYLDIRLYRYQGVLESDNLTSTRKRLEEFKKQLKKCRIPDSVAYFCKSLNINTDLNNLVFSKAAFVLNECGMTNIPSFSGYLLGYISFFEKWHDSCYTNLLHFFEGKLLPQEVKAIQPTTSIAPVSEPSKEDQSKIIQLRKKLDYSEKQLAHKKADHIRTEKKLLAEISGLKEELNELKELLAMHEEANDFNEYIDDAKQQTDDFDRMVQWLNGYKCLVVGGHDHWIKQMQEYFPNWIYWTSVSKPLQDTLEYDAMIFYPKHIGHSLYYKFVTACKNKNVPRCLLNHANIQKVTEQIYYMLKKRNDLSY